MPDKPGKWTKAAGIALLLVWAAGWTAGIWYPLLCSYGAYRALRDIQPGRVPEGYYVSLRGWKDPRDIDLTTERKLSPAESEQVRARLTALKDSRLRWFTEGLEYREGIEIIGPAGTRVMFYDDCYQVAGGVEAAWDGYEAFYQDLAAYMTSLTPGVLPPEGVEGAP